MKKYLGIISFIILSSMLHAQFVQQGSKLTAPDAVPASRQGTCLAISADGNTAVIGAPNDRNGFGAAWVFVKSGGVWAQAGNKLLPAGTFDAWSSPRFGTSVAVSADGSTIAIGAPSGGTQYNGCVYVFIKSGDRWVQQGTDLQQKENRALVELGISVAISADGNTIVAGGDTDSSYIGAAWVFVRNSGVWAQQGSKLVGAGSQQWIQQGQCVSISGDGNTLAIGSKWDNSYHGSVTVFAKNSGVWSQQGSKLLPSNHIGSEYTFMGLSISLSYNGNTMVTGGYGDNNNAGAVWVFTRSGSTWTPAGTKLTESLANAQQGYSVSISADGNTIISGGQKDNNEQGAAWIYVISGGVWTLEGSKLTASAKGNFGNAVSISSDGNTALIGSPFDSYNTGAAWVYTRSGSTWTQEGGKLTGTGGTPAPGLGNSVAVSSDGNTIIGGTGSDFGYNGSIRCFIRSGGVWSQQGSTITGNDNVGKAYIGGSTALSADGNTAIAGGVNDNESKGAAFVFTRTGGLWSQQGPKLVGTGDIGIARQGTAVGLSADGNTAIVGGCWDDNNKGAVWVFTRTAGVWSQQGTKLVGNDAAGAAYQGLSAAISGDGNTIISGGLHDNSTIGAAWIFTRTGGVWSQQGTKLVGSGYSGSPNQGSSVSISYDGSTAAIGSTQDHGNQGAVWIFTRSGEVWTQQGSKLQPDYTYGNYPYFGQKVSLSSDGNTLLISGSVDNHPNGGSLWVYTRSGGVWTRMGSKFTGTDRAAGSEFGRSAALSGDGKTAVGGSEVDDHWMGAIWVFYDPTCKIKVSAGVNGTISPAGISPVNPGDSLTVRINANSGYSIQDVLVDDVSVGAVSSYTLRNITADHTVSASFLSNEIAAIPVPVIAYPAGNTLVYTNSPAVTWYIPKWMQNLKFHMQISDKNDFSTIAYEKDNLNSYCTIASGLQSGKSYYARIRGKNNTGIYGVYSQTALFRTNPAPGSIPPVPVLIMPVKGSLVYTNSPVAAWYSPTYAPGIKYNVQVSQVSDFTSIVLDQSNITNINCQLPGLSGGVTYYWRVRSYTGDGVYSAFTAADSFVVNQSNGVQAVTPIILYPLASEALWTTSPVISWYTLTYAPGQVYNIQISDKPDFSSLLVNRDNITNIYFQAQGLTEGTVYYTRVRGRGSNGQYSLFSAVVSFTVTGAGVSVAPVAGSPVNEVSLNTKNAFLSWYTPGSAAGSQEVRYDLQVSNDAGFTGPQTVTAITGQSYNLTGLKSDSKYYWRVRSRTGDGKISAYSNEGVFITGKVITGISEKNNGEVKDYSLKQNYPNPFNPLTNIEFTVKNNGWIRLEVIDILGKVIKTLVNQDLQAGAYTVTMNGQGMSSGIYFYKLTTPDRQIINKMILSK